MRITWLRSSLSDLAAIELYVERDNPAAARAVKRRVVEAVAHLGRQPDLGRAGRVAGTRELVVSGTPYIVAYTVLAAEIVVLAVIHGARKWPETL